MNTVDDTFKQPDKNVHKISLSKKAYYSTKHKLSYLQLYWTYSSIPNTSVSLDYMLPSPESKDTSTFTTIANLANYLTNSEHLNSTVSSANSTSQVNKITSYAKLTSHMGH